MKKAFFEIDFMEQKIIIPKANVNFEHGLGVVGALVYLYNADGELFTAPILGVVDEDFNIILDYNFFVIYPKIRIFSEGKVLYVTDINENFNHPNYTIILKNKLGNIHYLDASNFREIDEELVLLEFDFNGRKRYNLFNVREERESSNIYDYVGEFSFKEEFGCEVAEVGYFVGDDEAKDFDVITFYINKNEEIVSAYSYRNQVFDKNMSLEDILESVNKSRI